MVFKNVNNSCVAGGSHGHEQSKTVFDQDGHGTVEESPSDMEHKPQSALPVAQKCEELHTYIMCGGGGTRLWPLSRADNPKQNLKLVNENSMLAETIARVRRVDIPELVAIVNLMGNESQFENMQTAYSNQGCGNGTIICEPFGKNTAPAVTIAGLHAKATCDDDPYVLILPSDHVIEPTTAFSNAITKGLQAADQGQIVLFGIPPTAPVTGFGYIEVNDAEPVSSVKSFKEKPDLETAKSYQTSGRHLWNAGIFLFRASTMLAALEKFAPEIFQKSTATLKASNVSGHRINLDRATFDQVPSDSIDFAVMEHAKNISVVRAEFDWYDVGSFSSLKEILSSQESNTVKCGDVIEDECSNSLLFSQGHLIAAIGLDNLSVVATPDVTLIAPLDRSEDIRRLVAKIESANRLETKHTPWLNEAGAKPGNFVSVWKDWLLTSALPFWLKHGLDYDNGGFHEVLNFAGESTNADKRLRTMARQIYVYGKALELGWTGDGKKAIKHGLKFLTNSPSAQTGGWCKTFDARSNPIDKREDAYDHAFVLLALAQSKKAGVDFNAALTKRVMTTLDSLRIQKNDGTFLGYAEDSLQSLPRRSNPHMHLLEAFLAFYEASQESIYLERAGEIVELFERHFFDAENLLLGEAFDQDLNFLDGRVTETEPGHHFEWAHLLHKFASLSKTQPSSKIIGLYSNAYAQGINPVTGLAYDVLSSSGKPTHYSSRCWVQTELLSCLSILSQKGKSHLKFQAERHAQNLWARYIVPAPSGMWIDVVDGQGAAVSTTVPASTFYHLIGAIENYSKNI